MQDMNKKKQELLFQELYNVLSAHIYNTGNMPTLVFTKEKNPSRVPAHHVRYSENEGRVTINMDEFGMKEEEIKAKLKGGFSGHVRIDNVPCELVSRFDVTTDVERVRNAVGAKGTVVEAPELGGCITQVAGRGISAEEMKMYTESAAPSNEGGVGVNPNGASDPTTFFSNLRPAPQNVSGRPTPVVPGAPMIGGTRYPNSVPSSGKSGGEFLCDSISVSDSQSYADAVQLLGFDPCLGGLAIPDIKKMKSALCNQHKDISLAKGFNCKKMSYDIFDSYGKNGVDNQSISSMFSQQLY